MAGGFGEDQRGGEPAGPVVDVDLKVLGIVHEAVADRPLDFELGLIVSVFRFPEGNEDMEPISLPIAVDFHTRRAAIPGEDLAVSPGGILIGNDVVLQKAYALVLAVDGRVPAAVLQFELGSVVEDFVESRQFSDGWQPLKQVEEQIEQLDVMASE